MFVAQRKHFSHAPDDGLVSKFSTPNTNMKQKLKRALLRHRGPKWTPGGNSFGHTRAETAAPESPNNATGDLSSSRDSVELEVLLAWLSISVISINHSPAVWTPPKNRFHHIL